MGQEKQNGGKGRIMGQLDEISLKMGAMMEAVENIGAVVERTREDTHAALKELSDDTKKAIAVVDDKVTKVREEQILSKARTTSAHDRIDKIEPTVEKVKFTVWAGGLIVAGITILLNWGGSIRPWLTGEHEPWDESRIEQPVDMTAEAPETVIEDKDVAAIIRP